MITFQTALYHVKYIDSQFGWDYDKLMFESNVYKEPWQAMMEFDFHHPVHPNWFATMRMLINDEIVEEDLFDASVIEYPF